MIELKDISAGYGGKEVLHQVSARFEQGKVTALIGPNGSGKSTLLKTMVGIIQPTAGEILVEGVSLKTLSAAALARQVAYLPQNRQAPDISVLRMVLHGRFAHLSYPRRYRRQDYEAAGKALEWVGLTSLAEEPVSRLSGGMQQKAYIAMALAQDADAILLDEPTTYLDIAHQLQLLEMIRQLADAGKAVILVMHDLSQALTVADELVILEDGRVALRGNPEQIYRSGRLEDIFGVRLERVALEEEWHYICRSK